ncbi:MAG: precorrin-3B C(17)-methyltransferase [Oscillospiraceae bacterium]|nr:precorrin-3B C(17)-methyltransferase [Oscillospiraceae bacterium]
MKKLLIVGLGPGNPQGMTLAARSALEEAQLICGYGVYVEQAAAVCPDTPVFTTPMTQEIERCRKALEEAAAGVTVAMVCSGDAGVYGMAAPVLELAQEYPPVEIEVVGGVTAAACGAAVLGAPLGHDFAVISLSDLLTSWQTIERRLAAVAQADFCIALYNPASRKRTDHLRRACEILLRQKDPNTVCGWVRNIGRPGQEQKILTLAQLQEESLDMFCTVFIGNRDTKIVRERMVTPRGYREK